MGEKKNDGGPAFPQPDLSGYGMGPRADENGMYQVAGMTLRDWFAGQALVEWSSTLTRGIGTDEIQKARIAKICYQFADAMIAERNK